MSSSVRLLALTLLLCFCTPAGAAHITDKLVVGVYKGPASEGTPLRLIASGTPLEVLKRRDGFSQIRLADDAEGWVESGYITDEKPAKAMLLETQAKLRQMGLELAGLREKVGDEAIGNGADQAIPPSAREAQLRQSLDKAQARIGELETQLADVPRERDAQAQLERLRASAGEALQLLAEAQGMRLTNGEPSPEGDFFVRHGYWMIGIGALLLGFAAGVAFIDQRIRRRYGGFRI